MERNARYFAVGLFVIVTTLAGFLFAGLFYQQQPRQQFSQYELQFRTSVEGLTQGSEVRYLGVKVGEVREVFLLPDSTGVGVRIRIAANTPINSATVATLRQQGLTGVTFVHLFQDQQRAAQPLVSHSEGLPVIATQPSDFDSLLSALPELQRNLNHVLVAFTEVLNAENRQNVSHFLQNLDAATAALPALVQNLQRTSQQLGDLSQQARTTVQRTEQGLAGNMQALHSALVTAEQALQGVEQAAQQVQQLSANVDQVVRENRGQVAATLAETQQTLQSVRRLTQSLQQNPTQWWQPSKPQGTVLPP